MSGGAVALAGPTAAFVVGLVGGAHCLGMCGPLVTLYDDRAGNGGLLRRHALFNLGRTAGYAAAGALLGALGATAFRAADVLAAAGAVRGVAGVAAGTLIAAVGAGYLLGGAPARLPVPLPGRAGAGRVQGALLARVDGLADGPGVAALGAAHALLPCPLLYPAFLFALARGSPAEGALTLAALGLGTFPTLFAYGTALGSLGEGARRRLHRALGAAFLLLATVPLAHGAAALGLAPGAHGVIHVLFAV